MFENAPMIRVPSTVPDTARGLRGVWPIDSEAIWRFSRTRRSDSRLENCGPALCSPIHLAELITFPAARDDDPVDSTAEKVG
jgi:hypothetical protein